MKSFRAFRVHEEGGVLRGRVEPITLDDVSAGEVVIAAEYSGINYKDALAATGAGKIMRRFPLVAGIDVAGHVRSSTDPRIREGDAVLVTGFGMSEDHDGGYAELVRVPAHWVIPLPAGLSLRAAMALGTAGLTVGIAIHQMELNGQRPEWGPVVVTGATGGVGSLAIDILSGLGYQAVAVTSKRSAAEYLRALGAAEVLFRDEIHLGKRPLESARWAGALDNVGGDLLGWITRTVKPRGNIASIGLAGGTDLSTTVMPFILRGVNLLGINTVVCPLETKRRIWTRLATDLAPAHLDTIAAREVSLDELPAMFEGHLGGRVVGRTVVRIRPGESSSPGGDAGGR